jgi:hypothetical protein
VLVVYVDQNFWIRLSKARQARPDPGFTELLKACERAVGDGRAQFVLSWANYEENWRRGSLSDRCQVAETMERLTAFTTMRTIWRLHEDVAGERHWTSKLNHPTVPTQSRNVSTARELVATLEATPP